MEIKREIAPVAQMMPVIMAAIEEGKTVEMTVTGNSMMPLLIGHVSSVRLIQPEDLQKGDIVLYRRNDGHYVLHRIVNIHNNAYDIVGDNQYVTDRSILKENIVAKAAAYNRAGKQWKENDALYRAVLPVMKTVKLYGSRVIKRLGRFKKINNDKQSRPT